MAGASGSEKNVSAGCSIPCLTIITRYGDQIPIKARSRTCRSNGWKKKGVRSAFWIVHASVLCRTLPALQRQAQQPGPNPYQLAEPPDQCEGDAGDIGIAEGLEEEQIPTVLRSEAAWDEEGATFDKNGECGDGDSGKCHGTATENIENDVDFQCFRHPT